MAAAQPCSCTAQCAPQSADCAAGHTYHIGALLCSRQQLRLQQAAGTRSRRSARATFELTCRLLTRQQSHNMPLLRMPPKAVAMTVLEDSSPGEWQSSALVDRIMNLLRLRPKYMQHAAA